MSARAVERSSAQETFQFPIGPHQKNNKAGARPPLTHGSTLSLSRTRGGCAPAHAPVPHAVALRAHAAMGVADILPLLKYASVRDRFYRRYRGKVVGVDAFVWLHELVAKHAHAVVVRRDTGAVVRELVYRCRILLSKDVTP